MTKKTLTNALNEKTKAKTANLPREAIDFVSQEALRAPVITEKATDLAAFGKYVFRIDWRATKSRVKRAVEAQYGVTVEKVGIVTIPSKPRRFGSRSGRKAGYKKAIVTLKAGDKIELAEGVKKN